MSNGCTFLSDTDRIAIESALRNAIEGGNHSTELVEVRFFKQYGEPAVELLIWKREGVTLSDCEEIHMIASAVLDEFDSAFSAAYVLNVSSLGLDRPILSDDDFRRALGTEIECFAADKTKIHGNLEAYDEASVTLSIGSQRKIITRNNLTKVQPYVRF